MLEITKNFPCNLRYFKGDVFLHIGEYNNGRMGITLNSAADGMPAFKATLNLPHEKLSSTEIVVKDYSENEGMLEFLQENNIVGEVKRYVYSGYVKCPVVEFNKEILNKGL